jgi:hypothetical protein
MKYFQDIDLPTYKNLDKELKDLNVKWFEHANPLQAAQICLNAPNGYTDDPSFGSGYFINVKDNAGTFVRFTDKGEEHIHLSSDNLKNWLICDVFKNTVFEEIFNMINKEYRAARIRFMKSKPNTAMNWHKDPIPRLHYPIQTQQGCLMVIEDEVYHMPLNKWTIAQTHKGFHTAINCSREERIHLVADVLPKT